MNRGNSPSQAWLACLSLVCGFAVAADRDWPAYGGDAAKTRHSPLKQINRKNVGRLELAWSHDTGEKGDTQTQPIVVGRVLYGYTPTHKAFAALDEAGRTRLAADITALLERLNVGGTHSLVVPGEYLEVVITKR